MESCSASKKFEISLDRRSRAGVGPLSEEFSPAPASPPLAPVPFRPSCPAPAPFSSQLPPVNCCFLRRQCIIFFSDLRNPYMPRCLRNIHYPPKYPPPRRSSGTPSPPLLRSCPPCRRTRASPRARSQIYRCPNLCRASIRLWTGRLKHSALLRTVMRFALVCASCFCLFHDANFLFCNKQTRSHRYSELLLVYSCYGWQTLMRLISFSDRPPERRRIY